MTTSTQTASVAAPARSPGLAPAPDAAAPKSRRMRFSIYRYDPDRDAKPYMQTLEVELQPNDKMLLDALMRSRPTSTTRSRFAVPAARASAVRTR